MTNTTPDLEKTDVIFHNLCYSVPFKEGHKVILDRITGRIRSGHLTIILGSSGAGKTSLLNVIAGEASAGTISGSLYLNGHPTTSRVIRKLSGFVFQEDIILDSQTVNEAIYMSAVLRNPASVSMEEKRERVSDVIRLLHLEKVKDTLIGSSLLKGISGGEKKRTSISMELVRNPRILFLDEPTSGLDTYNAFSVMKFLKKLARSGRTVVATLHQPSSEIFHLADDLILMSEGHIMYCGEANKSLGYFEQQGYICPKYSNPADFFFMAFYNIGSSKTKTSEDADISTTSKSTDLMHHKASATSLKSIIETDEEDSFELSEKSGAAALKHLLMLWPMTDAGKEFTNSIDCIIESAQNDEILWPPAMAMIGFTTQFFFLLRRFWNNCMRNWIVIQVKFIQIIIVSFLINVVFWKISERDLNSQIQNRAGIFFFLATAMLMTFSMGNLSQFTSERAVFQREHRSRMYSLPAYFLSKFLVDFPFSLMLPTLYLTIVYFAVGLKAEMDKFWIALLIVVLLGNCGTAIGLWGAATFPDINVGLQVLPVLLLPMMMFSGLFVNLGSLPVWIRWVQWFSAIKYGFAALMRNEVEGMVIRCGPKDGIFCRDTTGEQILEMYGLTDQGDINVNVLALFGFWAIYVALAYIGFIAVVRKSRGGVTVVSEAEHKALISKRNKKWFFVV